jgi:hypothetical protein
MIVTRDLGGDTSRVWTDEPSSNAARRATADGCDGSPSESGAPLSDRLAALNGRLNAGDCAASPCTDSSC